MSHPSMVWNWKETGSVWEFWGTSAKIRRFIGTFKWPKRENWDYFQFSDTPKNYVGDLSRDITIRYIYISMIYHINVAFINVPLYAVYSTYTCSIYSIAMIYVLLILPGCFCWQDLAKRIGEAEELQRRWMQVVHDSPGGFFWGFRRGCSHHLQFFFWYFW